MSNGGNLVRGKDVMLNDDTRKSNLRKLNLKDQTLNFEQVPIGSELFQVAILR